MSGINNGGGSSTPTRTTASITSSSLSNLASQSTTITMAKSYRVLSIQFDRAARITLAATTAIRDADVGRSVLVDPAAGVYLDVVSTGAQTIVLSGGSTNGSSMESTPSTAIPINIYNLSGSTSTVAITITYIAMEG